jgi:2-keto-4-pentenoate hydratase
MAIDRTRELAQALIEARRSGRALSAQAWADALTDASAAYVVQDAVAAELGWFAASPAAHAWKSGGPSRTAVLTHAALPPLGVRRSPADFADMAFHARGIEAEIALRLAVDVTPQRAAGLTHDDAASVVDAMTVSIEIVDSRWLEGSKAPALLRLADLQSHGALALGEWVGFSPRDWSAQRVAVRIGPNEREFTGTHALADPTWLLPTWLRHATRDGASVAAGTIVTTGTWCGVLDAKRGDVVVASFDGIGAVEVRV